MAKKNNINLSYYTSSKELNNLWTIWPLHSQLPDKDYYKYLIRKDYIKIGFDGVTGISVLHNVIIIATIWGFQITRILLITIMTMVSYHPLWSWMRNWRKVFIETLIKIYVVIERVCIVALLIIGSTGYNLLKLTVLIDRFQWNVIDCC